MVSEVTILYTKRSVGGYHFMYADTFLTEKEFNEMFDLTLYEIVREKYHAKGDKCLLVFTY